MSPFYSHALVTPSGWELHATCLPWCIIGDRNLEPVDYGGCYAPKTFVACWDGRFWVYASAPCQHLAVPWNCRAHCLPMAFCCCLPVPAHLLLPWNRCAFPILTHCLPDRKGWGTQVGLAFLAWSLELQAFLVPSRMQHATENPGDRWMVCLLPMCHWEDAARPQHFYP